MTLSSMKYLLIALAMLPLYGKACGNDEIPHQIKFSKGALYNAPQCHPVKVVVPTKYRGGKLEYATFLLGSGVADSTSLEVNVNILDSSDSVNESELYLCLNYEVAPRSTLHLRYLPVQNEDGVVSLCAQEYYIRDFMSHLTES